MNATKEMQATLADWRAIEDTRRDCHHGSDAGSAVDTAIEEYEAWCDENDLTPVYDQQTYEALGRRAAAASLWDEVPDAVWAGAVADAERDYPYHGKEE